MNVVDKDKNAIAAPAAWIGWGVNVIIKLAGTWKTPDGSGSGLMLQATDVQLLEPKQMRCPF